jgi:hypothetical protein
MLQNLCSRHRRATMWVSISWQQHNTDITLLFLHIAMSRFTCKITECLDRALSASTSCLRYLRFSYWSGGRLSWKKSFVVLLRLSRQFLGQFLKMIPWLLSSTSLLMYPIWRCKSYCSWECDVTQIKKQTNWRTELGIRFYVIIQHWHVLIAGWCQTLVKDETRTS